VHTRLGGPKRHSVEEKNPLPLPGIELWRGQPVTQPLHCAKSTPIPAAYKIQEQLKMFKIFLFEHYTSTFARKHV
jgi:hypothetical protein